MTSARAPLFTLFVPGSPEPAGSKRAMPARAGGRYLHDRKTGRPIVHVIDDNPASAGWKRVVAAHARVAWRYRLLDEPLELFLVLFVERPQSHYGRRGGLPYLRPDAPEHPTARPDVLKLARGVEDALTGVVWRDDSLIVDEHLRKTFSTTPGVSILVRRARAVTKQPAFAFASA